MVSSFTSNQLALVSIVMFDLAETDGVRTEDAATTLDYEDVAKHQPSADVKASHANATTIDDSSSQYETLTPAQNDAAVADVYQELGNNNY